MAYEALNKVGLGSFWGTLEKVGAVAFPVVYVANKGVSVVGKLVQGSKGGSSKVTAAIDKIQAGSQQVPLDPNLLGVPEQPSILPLVAVGAGALILLWAVLQK